jgi:hypothetical protein
MMKTLKSFARKLKCVLIDSVASVINWKLLNFSTDSDLVGVTYANEKHTDGAGSQLQRIYGIYAVSRLLNLPYIHSPLLKLDYQGLAALESNSSNQDVVSQYNQIFNIPSDIELPKSLITREIQSLTLRTIEQLKKEAKSKNTFILARVLYPYGIADAYPDAYKYVKGVSPFSSHQKKSVIRIAIHVRRGELFVVDSDRMLPNSYYISVAQGIQRILDELKLNYIFELHTELPIEAFVVTPSHHGIINRISDSVVVDPQSSKLEDFNSIPNLERFINTDAIETIQKMASADVLIMSHSSFSYLGAVLNVNGVIIYHKFWHSMLEEWLRADDFGHFSKRKFLKLFQKTLR